MRIFLVWVLVTAGVAHAETPAQIAKTIVTAQVDAIKDNNDQEKFAKTFAPDAVVVASAGGSGGLGAALNGIRGGSTMSWVDSAKLTSLTAGGDGKVVWISAEIELAQSQHMGPGPRSRWSSTIRVTELAVAEGGTWKVVAAMFGTVGTPSRDKYPPSEIAEATKRLTMTKFVTDPKQLAFQLPAKDDTVVVFGTDKGEKAVGVAAAKKLLESWKSLKLEIEGEVREVEAATYGYVFANINWVKPGGAPYRMRALVIATRETSQPWVFRAIQFSVP